jgi:hypothetical protein
MPVTRVKGGTVGVGLGAGVVGAKLGAGVGIGVGWSKTSPDSTHRWSEYGAARSWK